MLQQPAAKKCIDAEVLAHSFGVSLFTASGLLSSRLPLWRWVEQRQGWGWASARILQGAHGHAATTSCQQVPCSTAVDSTCPKCGLCETVAAVDETVCGGWVGYTVLIYKITSRTTEPRFDTSSAHKPTVLGPAKYCQCHQLSELQMSWEVPGLCLLFVAQLCCSVQCAVASCNNSWIACATCMYLRQGVGEAGVDHKVWAQ